MVLVPATQLVRGGARIQIRSVCSKVHLPPTVTWKYRAKLQILPCTCWNWTWHAWLVKTQAAATAGWDVGLSCGSITENSKLSERPVGGSNCFQGSSLLVQICLLSFSDIYSSADLLVCQVLKSTWSFRDFILCSGNPCMLWLRHSPPHPREQAPFSSYHTDHIQGWLEEHFSWAGADGWGYRLPCCH